MVSSKTNVSDGGTTLSPKRRRVGLLYDDRMRKHFDASPHPENPNRIVSIWEKLQSSGIHQRCILLNAKEAKDKIIALVHTKKHIDRIKSISSPKFDSRRNRIAGSFNSIYFNEGSSEAAYLAAGSVVEVAEKVAKGELDSAFAIVRPPGHHAEANEPMGFCLYNNVAIAASYLLNERTELGINKILIVDWDVHHGNGTQKMFWKDSRVLCFSVHRHESGSFYPSGDDGSYEMIGEGPGAGYNINVPWENHSCGDADYLAVWDHVLIPVAKAFDPDIIIISAGFDAAINDPLGGCCVSPYGYSIMLSKLMEFAGGKIVMALEGGYDIASLANSALACVEVLLDQKPVAGYLDIDPFESTWRVIQLVREQLSSFWATLAMKLPEDVTHERGSPVLVASSDSDGEFNNGPHSKISEDLAAALEQVIAPLQNVTVEDGQVVKVGEKVSSQKKTEPAASSSAPPQKQIEITPTPQKKKTEVPPRPQPKRKAPADDCSEILEGPPAEKKGPPAKSNMLVVQEKSPVPPVESRRPQSTEGVDLSGFTQLLEASTFGVKRVAFRGVEVLADFLEGISALRAKVKEQTDKLAALNAELKNHTEASQLQHEEDLAEIKKYKDQAEAEAEKSNTLLAEVEKSKAEVEKLKAELAKAKTAVSDLTFSAQLYKRKYQTVDSKNHELGKTVEALNRKIQDTEIINARLRGEVQFFKVHGAQPGFIFKTAVRKLFLTNDFGEWVVNMITAAVRIGKNEVLQQLMHACPRLLLKKSKLEWDPHCIQRANMVQQKLQKNLPNFKLLEELDQAGKVWTAEEVEKLDVDYDKDLDEVYTELPEDGPCEHDSSPFIADDSQTIPLLEELAALLTSPPVVPVLDPLTTPPVKPSLPPVDEQAS